MTIDFPNETETQNEMDAVLQAGRVLMESGAEIYRIEDTMGHMAKSLGIRDFSTYVVNRGVMISGLNRSGLKESRVLATSAPSIHLGKLEEVNRLSRELAEQPNQPVSSIFQKLRTIEHKTFYDVLKKNGVNCVVRQEHGTDIDAACGQLRSNTMKRDRQKAVAEASGKSEGK